ncbi:HpcH/HpaI aldolase/citrate lyase family protein [Erwinia sp. P6884]|uniref:HpcH/HpaI aldolase/citrate lyase family protein n=1 Tax=Erwinia sp. P6884 TaxID=3141450 RepID=UPI0031988FEE
MKQPISPFMLGGTLYMPALRDDIAEVILHGKIAGLRSLVICLEDAVTDRDVPLALQKLRTLLHVMAEEKRNGNGGEWPLVFIRPRNVQMARELIAADDLSAIDGFVLAKFTQASLDEWWQVLSPTSLLLMPTLETSEVYDVRMMTELAETLVAHPCRDRILALRIGGNDLMSVIGMRRPRSMTLYDGPLGYVIKMLVSVFSPRGFYLTAPVCELIDNPAILKRELELDVAHGLVGKTAIHPGQLDDIYHALRVEPDDYEDAIHILSSVKAVFKLQGAMCEPATHSMWAAAILERAKYMGVRTTTDMDNVLIVARQ